MPPLATHGEDGRRHPPPPLTGRGRSAASGLARANHRGPHHTPTLPTRLPHISAGGQEFEECGKRATCGGEKGSRLPMSAAEQDPGEPTGRRWDARSPEVCL